VRYVSGFDQNIKTGCLQRLWPGKTFVGSIKTGCLQRLRPGKTFVGIIKTGCVFVLVWCYSFFKFHRACVKQDFWCG